MLKLPLRLTAWYWIIRYLRNSHTPYRGNRISALAFLNLLRNGQDSYAPNWPAELLEYPNLFDFVGNDPLDGIDPWGLSSHWYYPGWLQNTVNAIWEALQEVLMPEPAATGAAVLQCGPDAITIMTNLPPRNNFINDPDNAPVPPSL